MYSNAQKKQKYVNFWISSGYEPHLTTVHGYASHPLWDVIRKPRAGYFGEALRQGQIKIWVSQNFFGLLDIIFKIRLA